VAATMATRFKAWVPSSVTRFTSSVTGGAPEMLGSVMHRLTPCLRRRTLAKGRLRGAAEEVSEGHVIDTGRR
jgi:hypothetical protein